MARNLGQCPKCTVGPVSRSADGWLQCQSCGHRWLASFQADPTPAIPSPARSSGRLRTIKPAVEGQPPPPLPVRAQSSGRMPVVRIPIPQSDKEYQPDAATGRGRRAGEQALERSAAAGSGITPAVAHPQVAAASPSALACPVCGHRFTVKGGQGQINCPQCHSPIKVQTGRLVPSTDSGPGPEADPFIGQVISGCMIDRKLGEGGMGSVYHARQLSLDRSVAIKILPPDLTRNSNFIRRFELEARSLARINHPNILHIYEYGEDPSSGTYYMVVEFVDGENLAERLRRRLRMDADEVLAILHQAALALHEASLKGVVHRDIKPDNLMLTRDDICKVGDFGLAKAVNSDKSVTNAGIRVGTPVFMSPEQCDGLSVDHRSDMYSLGITAFIALSGTLPFDGDNPFSIMLKHKNEPPPRLCDRVPDLDPRVDGLIQRLLAKDPARRFATHAELAQVIETLRHDLAQPVLAPDAMLPLAPSTERSPHRSSTELPALPDFRASPAIPVSVPVPPRPVVRSPRPMPAPALAGNPDLITPVPAPPTIQPAPDSDEFSALFQPGTAAPPPPPPVNDADPAEIFSDEPAQTQRETVRLIEEAKAAAMCQNWALAISRMEAACARAPGRRDLQERLSEMRAQQREREVEGLVIEGERLFRHRRLRQAVTTWRRATELSADYQRRQEIIRRIEDTEAHLRRRRWRQLLLGLPLILVLLIINLALWLPVVHGYLARVELNRLVVEHGRLDLVPAAVADRFLERHQRLAHWYARVFRSDYEPAVCNDLRQGQALVQVAQRQQKTADLAARLAGELDGPLPWPDLAERIEAARQELSEDLRHRLDPLRQRVADELSSRQAILAAIDKDLMEDRIAAALGQADVLRRDPRLGRLAGSLPRAFQVRVVDAAGQPVPTARILLDGRELGRGQALAWTRPINPPGLVVARPGCRLVRNLAPPSEGQDLVVTLQTDQGNRWQHLPRRPLTGSCALYPIDGRRCWARIGLDVQLVAADGRILAVGAGDGPLPWTSVVGCGPQGLLLVADAQGTVHTLQAQAGADGQVGHAPRSETFPPPVHSALLTAGSPPLLIVAHGQDPRRVEARAEGVRRWELPRLTGRRPPMLLARDDRILVVDDLRLIGVAADGRTDFPFTLTFPRIAQGAWLGRNLLVMPCETSLILLAFSSSHTFDLLPVPTALQWPPAASDPVATADGSRLLLGRADRSLVLLGLRDQQPSDLRLDLPTGFQPGPVRTGGTVGFAVTDATGQLLLLDATGQVQAGWQHPRPITAVTFLDGIVVVIDDAGGLAAYALP